MLDNTLPAWALPLTEVQSADPRPTLTLVDNVTLAPVVDLVEDETCPIEALRGIQQRRPDCSLAAYEAAYAAAGLDVPDAWVLDYLAARLVAPAIAARRGYRSGTGYLPEPPDGVGRWTEAQILWAIGDGGRRPWMIIPWIDQHGRVSGWQVRWATGHERVEVIETDAKGKPTKTTTHKFDFPAGRDRASADRLVDALHADHSNVVQVLIESPVRADSFASLTDAVSVAAVGGITMAYEGASNANNPKAHSPRISPDVIEALGGDISDVHILWCPDSDHASSPACNDATQRTIESALTEGALSVHVVDVPAEITNPHSGRVVSLGKGAGLDDLASHMAEIDPGAQWLGHLLADSVEARDYIAMYPSVEHDGQGLAEALADWLARLGTYRSVPTSKADCAWYRYRRGYWGIDVAEASTAVEATGCANRVFDRRGAVETAKARTSMRKLIGTAVKTAMRTSRGLSDLLVEEAQWEPREWAEYVPTPSGLLRPETLEMLPHTPEALNLGVTTVDWMPGAQNDDVDAFFRDFFVSEQRVKRDEDDAIGEIVKDAKGEPVWVYDAEKERMVQEVAGAALLGRNFDTALFLLGGGGAGISTFVGALSGVLPSVYRGSLTSEELSGKGDKFVLSGVVMARLTEVNEFGHASRLAEQLFKQIAQDNSEMPVEPKYGDKYNAHPRTTLMCTTNHLPGVSATAGLDNSLRRRACIARFPRIVANPDSGLMERLSTKAAREAILAWAVTGAHRFLTSAERKPFRSPESLRLVDEWLTDYDRLGAFVKEHLVAKADGYVERGEVHDRYLEWCEDQHIQPTHRMDQTRFTKALEERKGFGSTESNGNHRIIDGAWKRGWKGWTLVEF